MRTRIERTTDLLVDLVFGFTFIPLLLVGITVDLVGVGVAALGYHGLNCQLGRHCLSEHKRDQESEPKTCLHCGSRGHCEEGLWQHEQEHDQDCPCIDCHWEEIERGRVREQEQEQEDCACDSCVQS